MSPAEPIRVLLVEDAATDAEIEMRTLTRAGINVEHCVVDRETQFRAEIDRFSPHVIISDFSMPHFDGMAALALARELRPEIPFLFVSGTIGEENAIRALKSGATDYVLKSNLIRLPAAVERALHDSKERAARREAESMFRDVLEHAPDPMIVVNRSGTIVLTNGRSETVFGYARDQLVGRSVDVLVPESARDRHAGLREGFMQDAHARPMGARLKLMAIHRDGREIPVEISLAPLGVRREALFVAVVRDQTERRAQEERIGRLSRIRDLLSAANAAFMRMRSRAELFEEFCRIAVARGGFVLARVIELDASRQATVAATTGEVSDAFAGVLAAYNRDPAGAGSLLAHALRSGQPTISNDIESDRRVADRTVLTKHGNYSLVILPVRVEGKVAAAALLRAREPNFFDQEEMALLTEMTSNLEFALELQAKQSKLDYIALYDVLTGLPNRTLFMERLTQALAAEQRGNGSIALALIDLERFKAINDTLGQRVGDRVLQDAGRRLQQAAGDIYRVARLGGNLYAIMFRDIAGAEEVARRIEQESANVFGAPYKIDRHEIRIAAKAGIAVFPDDGADAGALFRNAEAALKRAKETGERYLFYAPTINARVSENVELEHQLRKAVEKRELFLHYQPKVDLATRKIVGLEALMRWQGADGRLVSPARFIPVLEDTGMILEAGRLALEIAADLYRSWKRQGLDAPRIAVNVSALQIRNKGFVDDIRSVIDGSESGIDLEITESLLMQDVDASIRKLKAVREAGLHIALDDFGTGHSSLAYLSKLPINTVKIDRSFVNGMLDKVEDTSIVTAIISLAQALHLNVVAEGVETEEQARLLRLLRCDQYQGYLFSKPVSAPEIEQLMLKQRTS
jgi:diguanylate cyclase (GGDEF)-like protein/PAS domain S-box-containing protein